jgi:hypothetical protein
MASRDLGTIEALYGDETQLGGKKITETFSPPPPVAPE